MRADTRHRTTWGNRFRFFARAVGLTGFLAFACGFALLGAEFRENIRDLFSWPRLQAVAQGAHGDFAKQAVMVAGVGAAVAVFVLAIELISAFLLSGGRRTLAGTTATVGIVAAVALLAFTNIYSFSHYARYDATRDKRFTLPPELANQLSQLRGSEPTTIVVLQMHNFGTLSPKRDSYTKAAEEKVTEKVKDLVDQFREFGPQFRVVVLDTEAFEYESELKKLTQDAPELKTAINAAPENSIFFHANNRVQRLSFNEFMQLDKTGSKEAATGENLVLLPQGIETFARRVLAIQERRPKVAVCVVHELLTTAADDPENRFTLAGLRKSLTAQGFDVVDIVLKKNWANARTLTDLKPAADAREESKLERLEGELEDATNEADSAREQVSQFEAIREILQKLKNKPWEERRAFYQRITRATVTQADEPDVLAVIERSAKRAQEELDEAAKKKKEAENRLAEAMKDERPLQDRRITDVAAKLRKQLADVDLLIIPRHTTEDAMKGPGVEATLHGLNKEQAKVAKEFMKLGKPVLTCLGPITPQLGLPANTPAAEFEKEFAKEITTARDQFEWLLAERGIELGRSVILFDGETRGISRGDQFSGNPVEVPPILIADATAKDKLLANPISSAFRLTGRTAERTLDLKLRALRPVSLSPNAQGRQSFAGTIAFTSSESWNELQPYPRLGRRPDGTRVLLYSPKYEPTGLNDPKKGTIDEERRDSFPIAVAIESKVPAGWVDDDADTRQVEAILSPLDRGAALGLVRAAERGDRPLQRTVVFGSGNLFGGHELKPAQEKLLLHSVNWLTAREDRLPKNEQLVWQYPRVQMSERNTYLWRLGAAVGLPLVAGYLGLLTMLRRRRA